MTQKLDGRVRRRQIAQAALQVIAQRGLGGLSMAGLARQVGLVPSAIYRHYRGKEEVLSAAMESIVQKAQANLQAVCRQTSDPLERIERLLMRQVAMVREIPAMPRIIFAEGPSGQRKAQAYGMLRGFLGALADIIRQGQGQGVIRKDVEAFSLAVMAWGLLAPAVILWYASEGDFDVTAQVQRGWKVFAVAIKVNHNSHKSAGHRLQASGYRLQKNKAKAGGELTPESKT
jgi:AcrR family transcriptional regulator